MLFLSAIWLYACYRVGERNDPPMISQQQSLKQIHKILPQQIQLLNLFFLNTMELDQRIQAELGENPMLEASDEIASNHDNEEPMPSSNTADDYKNWQEIRDDDSPDYQTEYKNYFPDSDIPHLPLKSFVHFKDDLKQQFRLLSHVEEDIDLGLFLIDLLNDRGMIDKDISEIADDYSFIRRIMVQQEDVVRVLQKIQTLDPPGIGARNVRECLLIQLRRIDRKKHPKAAKATILIESYYDELIHRQFEKILNALSIHETELKEIFSFLGSLNFYPVSDDASIYETKNNIIPDFIISKQNDVLQVSLYSSRVDKIRVNRSLYDQLSEQAEKDKNATVYMRQKLQAAEWFVHAIRQREQTMLEIMKTIMLLQEPFFHDGDIHKLKPMVLRNVADMSGYDISTVSRITANKYAETHFGIVWLKDLFSEGIKDKKGEIISSKVIQSVIREAVENEDKSNPCTDQQLVELLAQKGYNIARRTVAKYREQLQIPIARIRAIRA